MALLAPVGALLAGTSTAGLVSGGAGILGAGASALGAITGGEAAANQAKYQSQVAANNAQTARQNSVYSAAAGGAQAQETGLKEAAALGHVKASQAANNIDVNSGSATRVQESQREAGDLSQLNTENNALLQAYGYGTQATGYQAQSGLENYAAQTAGPAAGLSAGGSLLSSASSLPLKFGWMSNNSPAQPQLDNPGP